MNAVALPLAARPDLAAGPPDTAARAAAWNTAREFEALLLGQFAAIMFSGIGTDGPFGGGPAEDIYKTLLSEEYGKVLASAGGIGLAEAVYREIIKLQEVD